MTYINTTKALVAPFRRHVKNNWVDSSETNFLKKEIFARGAYLILTPASFVTHCLDVILGVGLGIGVLCSGRTKSPLYKTYNLHIKNSEKIISDLYVNFLRAINPTADIVRRGEDGFLSHAFIQGFVNHKEKWAESKNFLKRHVATRLKYALMAVSCVISRLADGIIGLSAGSLSLLTAGTIPILNHIAYRGLQITGIIDDLLYCTVKCINPSAKDY